jgi:iron-regulated transporter 1
MNIAMFFIIQALRCSCDRAWEFLLPILFTKRFPGTTLPVSISSALSILGALFCGPFISVYVNRQSPGGARFKTFLFVENFAVAVSGLTFSEAWSTSEALLCLGMFCVAVDHTVQDVLHTVVVKDWSVRLSRNSTQSLSSINSTLTLIDLGAAFGAPLLITWLSSRFPLEVVIHFLIGTHCCASLCVVLLSNVLYPQSNFQHEVKPQFLTTQYPPISPISPIHILSALRANLAGLSKPTQSVLIAYALLYFTVLSPSGVTAGWLASQGVPMGKLAAAQSFSQAVGAFSAYITPTLISRFGLGYCTQRVQFFQTACLLLAVFGLSMSRQIPVSPSFLSFSVDGENFGDNTGSRHSYSLPGQLILNPLEVFMLGLALSRFGLWSFDLCEREVLQLQTTDNNRVEVLAGEKMACQIASLLMSLVSVSFDRPGDFLTLVALSLAAVGSASVILFRLPVTFLGVK